MVQPRSCLSQFEISVSTLFSMRVLTIQSSMIECANTTLFSPPFVCVTVPVMSLTVLVRGGAASSKHRANNVGGNEASVWPLIGTQSSGGVWLAAQRWRLEGNLEHKCSFADSVVFKLQLSEPATGPCVCVCVCVCARACVCVRV